MGKAPHPKGWLGRKLWDRGGGGSGGVVGWMARERAVGAVRLVSPPAAGCGGVSATADEKPAWPGVQASSDTAATPSPLTPPLPVAFPTGGARPLHARDGGQVCARRQRTPSYPHPLLPTLHRVGARLVNGAHGGDRSVGARALPRACPHSTRLSAGELVIARHGLRYAQSERRRASARLANAKGCIASLSPPPTSPTLTHLHRRAPLHRPINLPQPSGE